MKSKGSEMLRRTRAEQRLTQHQAGTRAGIPAQQISDYERGVSAPARKAAIAIERELGVPIGAWDEPADQDAQAAG